MDITTQSGIYKITNSVNGRIYVGSAVSLRVRWYEHRIALRKGTHHNSHLQRSWAKHGEDTFSFTILELCEAHSLLQREQFWIDALKACQRGYGYNISPTAGSCLGMKHTPEARVKMHKAQLGNTKTRGQKRSDATKKKMSDSGRGKTFSAEAKARMSAAAKRKRLTAEHKAKIAASGKGRVVSAETRKKISATHTGKTLSLETRQRISETRKRLHLERLQKTARRQRLLFE